MLWVGVHALVMRARTGDEQAWQELHALTQPVLHRLAVRALGSDWPQQSISDLLQGTWLRAWKGIAEFKGGTNDEQTGALFRAWLGRILKNVRANDRRFAATARRKAPHGLVSLDQPVAGPAEGAAHDVADDGLSPSANLRAEERRAKILEALDRFADPKDRAVIHLRFFDGLSLAQISKRLALSYDNVRERFHRGLKRLHASLDSLE